MDLGEWRSRRLIVAHVLAEWCTEVDTSPPSANTRNGGIAEDETASERFRADLAHLWDKNAEARRHRQEREQITSYYEYGHTSPNPRTPHPHCPQRGPHSPHHFIAIAGVRRSVYCEGSPSTGR